MYKHSNRKIVPVFERTHLLQLLPVVFKTGRLKVDRHRSLPHLPQAQLRIKTIASHVRDQGEDAPLLNPVRFEAHRKPLPTHAGTKVLLPHGRPTLCHPPFTEPGEGDIETARLTS